MDGPQDTGEGVKQKAVCEEDPLQLICSGGKRNKETGKQTKKRKTTKKNADGHPGGLESP